MESVWSVHGFAVGFGVVLGGELKEPRRGDDLRSGRLQDRISARRPRVRKGIAELAPNWIFARHHPSWILVHFVAGCLALRGQVAGPGDPLGAFLVRAWRQLLAPSIADSGWFAGAQGLDLLAWVATA